MAKKVITGGDTAPKAFSLTDVLSSPVQSNTPAPPQFGPEIPAENNGGGGILFDPEIPAAPEPLPSNSPTAVSFEIPYGPGQSGEPNPADEPVNLSPDDIAIIAVNVFDGLQQFGLTLLSKNLMLTADEKELIGKLDHSVHTAYEAGSKEAIAMQKYRRHLENIKKLPFNDGEKSRLTTAGIIYARTLDVKVSPFQGIMMALTEVMTTRVSTIVMDAI